MTVWRHIPSFVDGVEAKKAVVADLDALLRLEWILNLQSDPNFDHWRWAPDSGSTKLLMAMMKDGKYWVVARVDGDVSRLPQMASEPGFNPK